MLELLLVMEVNRLSHQQEEQNQVTKVMALLR